MGNSHALGFALTLHIAKTSMRSARRGDRWFLKFAISLQPLQPERMQTLVGCAPDAMVQGSQSVGVGEQRPLLLFGECGWTLPE